MEWLRWWHGTYTDPKFRLVAVKAGATLCEVVSVWSAVLEHASAQPRDRGSLDGFDSEAIDAHFGMEEGRCEAIVAAFEAKGLIIGGSVANWSKRQPKREDDSTDRVRRYRERHRDSNGAQPHVTHGNATVTQCNHRRERREERDEKDTPLPPAERGTPAEPAVGAGVKSAQPQGTKTDPKEVARVAEWADDVFCGAHAGMIARDLAKTWPLAWVERMLQEAMAANPRHLKSWCVKRLQDWTATGGPPQVIPIHGARGRDSPPRRPEPRRMPLDEFEKLKAAEEARFARQRL